MANKEPAITSPRGQTSTTGQDIDCLAVQTGPPTLAIEHTEIHAFSNEKSSTTASPA